ncbi:MAG: hypothetical protein K8U03_12980 [Planctomycetia bacterium]|nr:hypothetical protein [Planctomycetia bacterium]
MDSSPLDRRQFNQLLGAAFGGLVTGSAVGCSEPKASGSAPAEVAADAPKDDKTAPKTEAHACRGLNACKGQAVDKKNGCAGQGTCANVKHHTCGGQNDCKNLGGCGKTAGANECKGQGGCAVPMHAGAWETARKHFEERMKKAGKKFGPAPAAPKPKE